MQYNKAMIDLVNRLRRSAPDREAHKVRLANEDLLTDLIAMKSHGDDLFLGLLAQLCERAGSPWPERFRGERHTEAEPPKKRRGMFYRGQQVASSQTPAEADKDKNVKPAARKIKRVYRGQVIYEDE